MIEMARVHHFYLRRDLRTQADTAKLTFLYLTTA